MFHRMGELLVEYGELTRDSLDAILAEQRRDYRAFGHIASERFGVSEDAIRRAWAEQYARYCPRIDLDQEWSDPTVYDAIPSADVQRRRLLPLRRQDGDLVLVTDADGLTEALRYVDEHVDEPTLIWLAEGESLSRALRHQVEQ